MTLIVLNNVYFFYIRVYLTGGNHGYNNSLNVMHPFFIAHGPAFKKNYKAKPFNNIDIYPLMCHILKISPYPNNGSLENIDHILYNNETEGFLIFNMTILTCEYGYLFSYFLMRLL